MNRLAGRLAARARPLSLTLAACAFVGCSPGERPELLAEAEREAETIVDARVLAALPPDATPDVALQGKDLFLVACAACHGEQGVGTALGPSLISDGWMHTQRDVERIAELVRSGVPAPQEYPVPMPPRADLADEELRALGVYVYALRGLQ